MPYTVSLAPDRDRGGHRYRLALSEDVSAESLRELSDWVADAKQNPDARFELDIEPESVRSARARFELRALLRRHPELRQAQRITAPL